MSTRFQRLTSFVLAAAMALPLSAGADDRTRRGTEIQRLEAELEQHFGKKPRSTTRTSTAPRAAGPASTASLAAEALVASMNRERAAHGLGPLRLNSKLSLAAEDRVDDMVAKRYFDHVSPDGINPFTWVEKRGYRYRAIGENLATGFNSADAVVGNWMRSPGHRQNILTKNFDEIGIAVTTGGPVRPYRGPLVVALYGTR
ncbi:MAG TPA: CAP domain-containing protein [Thermoanaerobaculia bacterium]